MAPLAFRLIIAILATTTVYHVANAQSNNAAAPALIAASSSPSTGCTTTMTLTQSRLPTPPYWPQCEWDGTLSIYTSTVTISSQVDCNGCTDVRVTQVPVVHCPFEGISTSVVVQTPKTTYRTVCSASVGAAAAATNTLGF